LGDQPDEFGVRVWRDNRTEFGVTVIHKNVEDTSEVVYQDTNWFALASRGWFGKMAKDSLDFLCTNKQLTKTGITRLVGKFFVGFTIKKEVHEDTSITYFYQNDSLLCALKIWK